MTNQKRGDILDGILFYQKKSNENNLPDVIYDYPETVIEKLKLFYRLWSIPVYAIPSKTIRGRYSEWVKELQELQAENDLVDVMTLAADIYWNMNKRFIISRPLSIKKLMIEADSEINHRKSKIEIKKENEKIEEIKPTINPNSFRNLKSGE